MTDIDHYEDVEATCNHQPGPDAPEHTVHVHGIAVFAKSGWAVDVHPTPGNTTPRADLLSLDLIAHHSGDMDRKVLTPVPFDWSEEVEIEPTEVQFVNLRGAEGTLPSVVTVQRIESAV